MSIPNVWMEPRTSTAVLVEDAFKQALSADIFAEIENIECAYELMDDSVSFYIQRKRDGMKVRMPVAREWLSDTNVEHTVAALQKDQQMFARLVLFLA